MELNKVLKRREVTRNAFVRVFTQLKDLLMAETQNSKDIQVSFGILEQRNSELKDLNDKIMLLLLDDDNADFTTELESVDAYLSKFLEAQVRVTEFLNPVLFLNTNIEPNVANQNVRKFRLPKLEFRKFSDDIRDWLPFWSQFEKIHKDAEIADEDKFQYLVQATVEGSRAREIVESFPPVKENYPKAVESLKARFGRENLLVEVYVRELLQLIISVHQSEIKDSKSFSFLYDKLESQLRALETLGVTTDKCAAMLFPLVESCFSEEFLKAWHRNTTFTSKDDPKDRLNNLMNFLKTEVESEQHINLAVERFGLSKGIEEKGIKKKRSLDDQYPKLNIPSASALTSATSFAIKKCIFCDGKHPSANCFTAQKMSITEIQKRLKEKGCCFGCLKPGHQLKQCYANLKCNLCGKRHVTLICEKLKSRTPQETKDGGSDKKDVTLATNIKNPKVFLQTMKVKLISEKKELVVRVVCDSGSQKSYVRKDIVSEMKYVPIREETLSHSLFGGVDTQQCNHNCYMIRLADLENKFRCRLEVLDQKIICNNVIPVSKGPWLQELKQMNIKLTDIGDVPEPVHILLGADVLGKLMTGRRRVLSSGLVAIETHLGWTLMGKAPQEANSNISMVTTSMFVNDMDLSNLWKLDSIGITDPIEKVSKSEQDFLTEKHFLKTVKFTHENRYEVELPWMEDNVSLPDNFELAKKSLNNTTSKLLCKNLYDAYENVFLQWLELGIIEEVPLSEINSQAHYLPHRPVIKESSSTTPIRPVFNASARISNYPSLNQCLQCGPNLIELIPNILLRFREKKVGVIADITKAFLQISVCKRDRDFLRFLWWNNKDRENYKVFRHKRVVFGVKSSPFLLNAVIEYHIKLSEESYPFATSKLSKSFYVDNLVASIEDREELTRFISDSNELMMKGGFELRSWEYSANEEEGSHISPVLGLHWDVHSDVLKLDMSWLKEVDLEHITKRTMLSATHKIFDPLGFVSAVMICPKLLLQKSWKLGFNWDEDISNELREEFLSWFEELEVLNEVNIPRWTKTSSENLQNCSLHTFCDASKNAYAAVIYLRIDTSNGIEVFLLASKARITPLKNTTIPRLELLAALLGTRLTTYVIEALDWKNMPCYYWSDSSTVLTWITTKENWSIFVHNRVTEIRKFSQISSWGFVEGNANPADMPSRGCKAKQLVKSRWWEGPQWMKDPIENWPCSKVFTGKATEEIEKEKRKATVCSGNIGKESLTNHLANRFSNYVKIVRTVAWILRFLKKNRKDVKSDISSKEFSNAENILFRCIQSESFSGEGYGNLKSLLVFKDDQGLIRTKSRIIDEDTIKEYSNPIVLPAKHPIIEKMIQHKHLLHKHAGTLTLLTIIREKVWLLKGRRAVNSVVRKCVSCQRYQSKALEAPLPPLPKDRTQISPTFQITGVDLAGPIFTRSQEKCWIVIFTCAVYRAVHLELIQSLSSSAFVQALRRFIARRGRISVMYSDNGTNFVGVNAALKQLNWNDIEKECSLQNIQWKFIPPSAPWWGGFWERLIRMLKDLLKRNMGRASLSYEEIYTLLCECESIMNNRPITYVSEESNELSVLKPSMFLQSLPNNYVTDLDMIETTSLGKKLNYLREVRENLRKRFKHEYLGLLQFPKQKLSESVKVNDIVLIGDDNKKRLDWPIAKVIDIFPGKDGVNRLVRVKTSTGTHLRPIQKLYPLEIN